MAIQEQLEILKQGVDVWNKWRSENNSAQIDLSEVNLSNANLSNANLNHARLILGDLNNVNLSNANLEQANLYGTDLNRANLTGANLTEAYFRKTRLRKADLSKANLEGAKFNPTRRGPTDLSGAILRQANLKNSNFESVILMEVDLSEADLNDADFRNAELREANLGGANLTGTNLSGADLSNANLGKARIGHTIFGSVNLSKTNRLQEVEHISPSIISLDTIHLSKGQIPTVFLRGCGLSDIDIEYAKLANPGMDSGQVTDITYKIHQLYLGSSLQYYSCFISYSSKDQEFAQLLHDDLQNNGVRCWFDREDLKIGDSIRPAIDRQIRLRDKLLVILSENSITSEWVGDEVEGALEEEQKGNRSVLFPIRLDDTALNTRDDWAAKIKRRRHIGDFSNWKDKVSYQKAFERLLRDLKATGE